MVEVVVSSGLEARAGNNVLMGGSWAVAGEPGEANGLSVELCSGSPADDSVPMGRPKVVAEERGGGDGPPLEWTGSLVVAFGCGP